MGGGEGREEPEEAVGSAEREGERERGTAAMAMAFSSRNYHRTHLLGHFAVTDVGPAPLGSAGDMYPARCSWRNRK